MKANKILCLMAGTVFMINIFGCNGMKYEKYSGKDDQINVSMDYIAGWEYREDRGANNSYSQVTFLPKARKNWLMIDLVAQEGNKIDVSPLSLKNVEKDTIDKRMKLKDAKVLSISKIKIMGTDAVSIEMSYQALENLKDINANMVSLKEKIIILNKDGKFYFLRYMNSAKDFSKYNAAFMHIARTMKLKNDK